MPISHQHYNQDRSEIVQTPHNPRTPQASSPFTADDVDPHVDILDVAGRHGAGKVVMRTAPQGTGIIAGGPMRAVFEMLGVQDVVAKSLGSQNPYNMIRATLDGLTKESSPRSVAQRRGKKVADILPKRDEAHAANAAVAEEES